MGLPQRFRVWVRLSRRQYYTVPSDATADTSLVNHSTRQAEPLGGLEPGSARLASEFPLETLAVLGSARARKI